MGEPIKSPVSSIDLAGRIQQRRQACSGHDIVSGRRERRSARSAEDKVILVVRLFRPESGFGSWRRAEHSGAAELIFLFLARLVQFCHLPTFSLLVSPFLE